MYHRLVRWKSFQKTRLLPSTVKMETIFFSETSIDIQWITQPYIPEDSTHYSYLCENDDSYIEINYVSSGWAYFVRWGELQFVEYRQIDVIYGHRNEHYSYRHQPV